MENYFEIRQTVVLHIMVFLCLVALHFFIEKTQTKIPSTKRLKFKAVAKLVVFALLLFFPFIIQKICASLIPQIIGWSLYVAYLWCAVLIITTEIRILKDSFVYKTIFCEKEIYYDQIRRIKETDFSAEYIIWDNGGQKVKLSFYISGVHDFIKIICAKIIKT